MDVPRADAALHRVIGVLLLALTLLGCVSGAMAGSATAVQHQRHVHVLHAGPVAEAGDGMRAGAGHMCGAWTDRCPDARFEKVPYTDLSPQGGVVAWWPPRSSERPTAGSCGARSSPGSGGRFALCVIRT
ncbi:hypothetical protein [Streptomyces sp. TRM68367]|uniref:hypothetical protein n=1 Tax=Streptomyces sp. TRM68367 TaxID=2758415 RepID=UPI00165AB3B4|nr:hypothetical protein [Streptomyces sp. TRM68367]MBC9730801.1 hypothetical protein [Streptomyces sp. TRM68367]